MKAIYTNFYNDIHKLACNIICISCDCIDYDLALFNVISSMYDQLYLLTIDHSLVPFDFSCEIHTLDDQYIMIDKVNNPLLKVTYRRRLSRRHVNIAKSIDILKRCRR